MTNLAKEMRSTTVVSPETAPHLFSSFMMQAFISTVPYVVSTDLLRRAELLRLQEANDVVTGGLGAKREKCVR
ncbi:hypothetical protein ACFX11_003936 [Malus domestica]